MSTFGGRGFRLALRLNCLILMSKDLLLIRDSKLSAIYASIEHLYALATIQQFFSNYAPYYFLRHLKEFSLIILSNVTSYLSHASCLSPYQNFIKNLNPNIN